MITIEQYFGSKPHTPEHEQSARELLTCVNTMLLEELAWNFPTDPDTGTSISGSRGGSGDGGFRLPTATTGRQNSSHKEAKAVDVFDPENKLDDQLSDAALGKYGLYREHPDTTQTWCHLTTRAPGSNKRTFWP